MSCDYEYANTQILSHAITQMSTDLNSDTHFNTHTLTRTNTYIPDDIQCTGELVWYAEQLHTRNEGKTVIYFEIVRGPMWNYKPAMNEIIMMLFT